MSKLKGRTVIELIDPKTGQKEVVADDNMIGPAVDAILGLSSLVSAGLCLQSMLEPLYKKMFGGIYLFDDVVPESQVLFPITHGVVGAGAYEYSNIYSSVIGAYNKQESEVSEKLVKHVWDFATSQGNGTIASVCLGNNKFAERAYFGCDYTKFSDATSLEISYPKPHTDCDWAFPMSMGRVGSSNYKDDTNKFVFHSMLCEHQIVQANYSSNFCGLFYANDLSELVTIRLVSEYNAVIERWGIEGSKVGLTSESTTDFYNSTSGNVTNAYAPCNKHTLIESKDVTFAQSGNSFMSWYDVASQKFYVIARASTLAVGASCPVNVFDFSNGGTLDDCVVSQITFTNTTSSILDLSGYRLGGVSPSDDASASRFAVVDGYFYFTGNDCFYKVKVSNNSDVKEIKNENVSGFSYNNKRALGYMYDDNGMLYVGHNLGNTIVINTKQDTVKICRNSTYAVTGCTPVSECISVPIPTKTYSLFFMAGLRHRLSNGSRLCYPMQPIIRNSYLSTINNLQTPVVKTADKTMKITYILREVE